MKTQRELSDLADIVGQIGIRHYYFYRASREHRKHKHCKPAVCLKCGSVIYSCQPEWAERQCPCDAPSFDKVWHAYEELVKE